MPPVAENAVETMACCAESAVGTVSVGTAVEASHLPGGDLFALTDYLRISSSEHDLAKRALDWLAGRLSAESVAVQYLADPADELPIEQANDRDWIVRGDCPVSEIEFNRLTRYLELGTGGHPVAISAHTAVLSDWPSPTVQRLVVATLSENGKVFARLAAFNPIDDCDFDEADLALLRSISDMLIVHHGNREHYRQQTGFLAEVVRAMSSAIDAKDPYTCGHSDRVARFSVRLARELGWHGQQLVNIYMAGLLHDIGKIGIDESLLRKPEPLTEDEYEQIKQHPALGYRILVGIQQLAPVLPAVLYHHEQWNGGGYPEGLRTTDIPQIARIVAVADAYDAMTSDRPYRAGMPRSRVHDEFRDGTGEYWDPKVIEIYFRIESEIARMAEEESEVDLGVHRWF